MDPLPFVDRRFRIDEEAGRGGMGIVYRAHDLDTDRPVALKVFRAESRDDYVRFEREVEALAVIDHPRVVRAIAHGLAGDGSPYVAMEWLDGEDLAARLDRGRLDLDDALLLVTRLAEALGAAHRHGIIHRDVKPSNVFLVDGASDVRLIDFGIARPVAPGHPLTATGVLVGTPAYMAPEQARGDSALGPRADVFAIGCVLYHCLCGVTPFAASHEAGTLWRLLEGRYRAPSEIVPRLPREIDVLMSRLLAASPGDRPAGGDEVAATLASLAAGEAFEQRPIVRLGTDERLLQCAVMTGPAPDAPTRLADAANLAGCTLRMLPDGSLLGLFDGGASLHERCRRATRFADELAIELGDVAIAVRTGRDLDTTHDLEPLDVRRRGTVDVDTATGRVLAASHAPGREPAAGSAPLLGRARELANLAGLVAEAAQDSIARAALVIAPPGVGKTHLVRELAQRVERDDPTILMVTAEGDPFTAGSPLALVATLLRRALGLDSEGDLDERRRQLDASLAGDLPRGELEPCSEFFAELLGLAHPAGYSPRLDAARLDAILMNDAMLAAWQLWLERRLERAPVLFVVEDLHWVDLPSLCFFDRALQVFADRPLCVIATGRPELRDRLASLSAMLPAQVIAQVIVLEPLSARPAEELARLALGDGARSEIAARIASHAAGNPLHILELARRRAGDEGAPLTDDLLATIETRLARLPAPARRALRAASVFGLRFWAGGLAALLGESTGDVRAAIEVLRAEDLVEVVDGSRLPGEDEFVIVHPLAQEAAYRTLPEADRNLAHRLAARWLADTGWIDASVVAEHHQRGGASTEAVTCYLRAARTALDRQALSQTIELAGRGIDCGPTQRERGTLELLAAEAHAWRGDLDDALASGRAAAGSLAAGSLEWLHAQGLIITVAGQTGDNDSVEARLDDVLATTVTASSRSARAICVSRAATQLAIAGRTGSADRAVAALDALVDEGDLDPIARGWIGRVHATLALREVRLDTAITALEEALAAYQQVGDQRSACLVRVFLGSLHTYVGELEQAHEAIEQVRAVADRIGASYLGDWALYVRGKILTEAGEVASARAVLDSVLTRLAGSPRIVAGARLYLSIGAERAGDHELAAREAQAALDAHQSPPLRAAALAALARARLGRGATAEATNAARAAHAELERVGAMEELEALVRLAHAECEAASSNFEVARAALRDARRCLQGRAELIADPLRRVSFLERVELHRRILSPHGFE